MLSPRNYEMLVWLAKKLEMNERVDRRDLGRTSQRSQPWDSLKVTEPS